MINKNMIGQLWQNWSFEIILVIGVLFMIGLAIRNSIKGVKGTWTKDALTRPELNRAKFIPQTNSHPRDSQGEVICRRVLETLYGKPFRKARPDWLNNSVTNNNLELDCYNAELRLAVEYQGEQHYRYNKFFHKNKEDFRNGQYRDEMKRRMCRDRGVTLIEIPYTIKPENIEFYLRAQLTKAYNK